MRLTLTEEKGDALADVARVASNIARAFGCAVAFDLKGRSVRVAPGEDQETVAARWQAARPAKRKG